MSDKKIQRRFSDSRLPQDLRAVYDYAFDTYSALCDQITSDPSLGIAASDHDKTIMMLSTNFMMAEERARLLTSMPDSMIDRDTAIRISKLSFLTDVKSSLDNFGDLADRFNFKDKAADYIDGLDDSYIFPDLYEIKDGAALNNDETLLTAANIIVYSKFIDNKTETGRGFIAQLNQLGYSLNKDTMSKSFFRLMEQGLTKLKDLMYSSDQAPGRYFSN